MNPHVFAQAEPEISLVVCTRNRAQFLPRALASFRCMDCSRQWELILVDSASTDETGQLLQAFARDAVAPTLVLRTERAGLSIARNLGWRAARGRIVAFTDDDCYPWPDFLDQILQTFENQPELGYLGGRILLHDPADLPITIQTLNEVQVLPARQFLDAGFIHGANFAVQRSLLAKLQGFDNRLGAGAPLVAGEDTDLLVRAAAAGALGRYEPAVVVEHHHRRQQVSEMTRLEHGYAIGRGAYQAKALLDTTAFDGQTRRLLLKQWYWSMRAMLRNRQTKILRWEIQGAFRYILLALKQGRHLSD